MLSIVVIIEVSGEFHSYNVLCTRDDRSKLEVPTATKPLAPTFRKKRKKRKLGPLKKKEKKVAPTFSTGW